jgi:hypothetical protein
MNQERIEFALKILAWEVDAARSRLRRRKKKLQADGEITAHLLNVEQCFHMFNQSTKSFKRMLKHIQNVEDKEFRNMQWKKGKDMKRHAGRNQMALAYGRKRSS